MTVDAAAKRALMTVPRRWRALDDEARELSRRRRCSRATT